MIIVTSGAVGVGCHRLGLANKPTVLAKKQALAAVGQVHLMKFYEDFLQAVGLVGMRKRGCGRGENGSGGWRQMQHRGRCSLVFQICTPCTSLLPYSLHSVAGDVGQPCRAQPKRQSAQRPLDLMLPLTTLCASLLPYRRVRKCW